VVILGISTKKISNSRFSYCESILAIDLLPISFKNNDLFSNTVCVFFKFLVVKKEIITLKIS
jgi:hypothetical protein